jgi:hypothetical protein
MATYYAFSGCSSGQVIVSNQAVDGSLTDANFYFAELQLSTGGVAVECFVVTTGTTPSSSINFASGPFDSCVLCNNSRTTVSAGTNYTYCQIVCNDTNQNITVSAKTVNHAVWTNSANVDVIQMNSVVLGGFNGLNS